MSDAGLTWRPARSGAEHSAGLVSIVGVSVLDDILVGVREDLAARQESVSLTQLQERAARLPSARDAFAVLSAEGGIKVIAEVKRASPSKGALAAINDPAALA